MGKTEIVEGKTVDEGIVEAPPVEEPKEAQRESGLSVQHILHHAGGMLLQVGLLAAASGFLLLFLNRPRE